MELEVLPSAASWAHHGARTGFEVAFFSARGSVNRVVGHTTANEDASPWSVGYEIELDALWRTRTVRATSLSKHGSRTTDLARAHDGAWTVNGAPAPELDGCIDVDFESSAVTNLLPLRRLNLGPGSPVDVPAAFVRAGDLRVERLEQRYTLVSAASDGYLVDYESATFGFSCRLRYDAAGLIVEYPGIAARA